MLQSLRCSYKTGIEGGRAFIIFKCLFAFFNDTVNRRAGFTLCAFADNLKDLLQALYLPLGDALSGADHFVFRSTSILIALLAITTLGNSAWVVLGVVSVLFTPVVARTVRSAVLAERDLDYVTSAKLRGESSGFIMFREILPNVSGPIIVELTVRVGYAVFTVATLSFLGAGPPPPSPDWGAQVSEGYVSLSAGIWWTTFFPALAIASLVIAVNLIADSVQSVLEAS